MHNSIKKEKSEINILTSNLNARKKYGATKNATVIRPDTLEIRKKPDNVSNIINKPNLSQENGANWCDNIDNFITHLKNVNNTPSPITPTSFFNPSDVTQDQEQFADTLTVHLNKIKEEYKSSIESSESNYINNVIQLSAVNDERPLQITTVSVGNKVYLVNQIPTSIDDSSASAPVTATGNINYGLIDLPTVAAVANNNSGELTCNNISTLNPNTIIIQQKAPGPLQQNTAMSNTTNLSQQLKISNITSLRNHCNTGANAAPNIVFSTPNIQQFNNNTSNSTYNNRLNNQEVTTTVLPLTANDITAAQTNAIVAVSQPNSDIGHEIIQPVNFIKASDGILYTRIPDSSQSQLINQLNSLVARPIGSAQITQQQLPLQHQQPQQQPQQQQQHQHQPQPQTIMKPVVNLSVELNNQPTDNRCLSVNSSATESSNGVLNSSVNNSGRDSINNNNSSVTNKHIMKDEKDVDEQQRRLERKRARNRDAARKCRDRKNTLILTLEQKYAKQCAEKELIREKLLKSLEEIRRLTDYIAKHDPNSNFSSFSNFLQEIKIHELTDTDLKELNSLS